MINHSKFLIVLALTSVIFLSGCVSEENLQTSMGKEKANNTQLQAHAFFSDINFSTLVNNPESYKDSEVKISGEVFNILSKSQLPWGYKDFNAFQMYQGKYSSDRPNILVVYNPDVFKISNNSICVEVHGIFKGAMEAENVLSNVIMLYLIKATEIKEKDCLSVLYPPEKTISKPIVKGEDNVKLTISKIEFTNEHTRIYLRIENNRETEISFRKYNSYLVQNKRKYDETSHPFNIKVEEPDIDIPAGLITEGWIFFEPVNPDKSFTIHLELADFETFLSKKWEWEIVVLPVE